MASSSDGPRLPPPWITPAAGLPNREVPPVIIVQRRRLLYPAYVQDYLDRVTAADVAAGDSNGLEVGVTDAVSSFLQDLVSISYLGISGGVISQAASVIKASLILAGARTRAGARVPVVGPAPTEFGTAGGWNYSRKTGTAGNATDNYLNSNRSNSAEPPNSKSMGVFATTRNTEDALRAYMGEVSITGALGYSQIMSTPTPNKLLTRLHDATSVTSTGNLHAANGFFGISRNNSSNYIARGSGINETIAIASSPPSAGNIFIFARNLDNVPNLFSNARIAWYFIGENLNLALLDTRVTALINAYAAAIP